MEEERGQRKKDPKDEKTGWKYASLLSKIVFGLCIVAFILHMIGFYTPSWSEREFVPPRGTLTHEGQGLWNMCRASYLYSKCFGAGSPFCRFNDSLHLISMIM